MYEITKKQKDIIESKTRAPSDHRLRRDTLGVFLGRS